MREAVGRVSVRGVPRKAHRPKIAMAIDRSGQRIQPGICGEKADDAPRVSSVRRLRTPLQGISVLFLR
jgi:hypothetical protein